MSLAAIWWAAVKRPRSVSLRELLFVLTLRELAARASPTPTRIARSGEETS
jgi:hypothetical protein